MVNELVFRAADTATALEKVQDNLGENAYIIEIKNVGNFVEITASLQEPVTDKGAAKTAPKNSVLVLSKRLQENAALPTRADDTKLGHLMGLEEFKSNTAPMPQTSVEHEPLQDTGVDKSVEEGSLLEKAPDNKTSDQKQNEPTGDFPASETLVHNTMHEPTLKTGEEQFDSDGHSTVVKPTETLSDRLSFGDLLNIGLSGQFIKKEFSISEFSGSITKDHLLKTLVRLFWDPSSRRILDVYYNIVLLGTPGSGKSTICAKLMQHYCLFREEKPRILQVSPDKFFELDRLSYCARLFNLPFEKQQKFNSEAVFHAEKQLTEISWDYYFDFFEALAQKGKHLPHAKLLLVLPASINTGSLAEVLRVSRGVNSVILNKCDYGRITIKHLMMLYQNNCKIVGLSGDTEINEPIEFVDESIMRGFIKYVLGEAL